LSKFKSSKYWNQYDNLYQGLKDALTGNKALLTDKEVKDVMEQFQKEMSAKQEIHMRELAVKTKKKWRFFNQE